MSLVLEDELLELSVVRSVSIVVKSTGLEPCSTHEPASTGDQEQFKAVLRTLVFDVALDESDEPVSGYLLRLEVLAQIIVPHVAHIHRLVIPNTRLLFLILGVLLSVSIHGALLSIESEFEVVAVVEGMPQILLDLLLDRVDHLALLR